MRSNCVLSSTCIAGLFLVLNGAAAAQTGALTQLPGTAACVGENGGGADCADGVGLNLPASVAVSRDGRNVYVGSGGSDSAVAVLARNRRTGALTHLPGTEACVSEDGTDGDCADGVGLIEPVNVAVSHDGRNVYVASGVRGAVAVFARDRRTGALTELPGIDACVSWNGSAGDGAPGICAVGVALFTPEGIAVSPDGRNIYVAALNSAAVAVFARDHKGRFLAAR